MIYRMNGPDSVVGTFNFAAGRSSYKHFTKLFVNYIPGTLHNQLGHQRLACKLPTLYSGRIVSVKLIHGWTISFLPSSSQSIAT